MTFLSWLFNKEDATAGQVCAQSDASVHAESERNSFSTSASSTQDKLMDPLSVTIQTGSIRIDKIPGKGEDAAPIALIRPGLAAVGVFDGMGGSGSETYNTSKGRLSGASIGSEVASNAVRWALESYAVPFSPDQSPDMIAAGFRDVIANQLKTVYAQLGGQSTGLKGKLIRKFPTTVALALIYQKEDADGNPSFYCLPCWAGDSRVYLLSGGGLMQLTSDHLSVPNDAMQNILQDSELSNFARADSEFHLASNEVLVGSEPFLVIAASDGAFGYLPTPMHFEKLLLQTQAESDSYGQWQERLKLSLSERAQDDVTLAYAAVGWPTFHAMKSYLSPRLERITTIVKPIDDAAETLDHAHAAVSKAQQEFESTRLQGWENYRTWYEDYLPSEGAYGD